MLKKRSNPCEIESVGSISSLRAMGLQQQVYVLAWLLLACWAVAQARAAWQVAWSQDSYAMLGLGESVWQGHGFKAHFIRDHAGLVQWPQPSRSFPPAWPLLVGGLQSIVPNLWPWPQVLAALLCCWLPCWWASSTALPLQLPGAWAGWWAAYVWLQAPLREEILAARAIPAAVGLVVSIGWFSTKSQHCQQPSVGQSGLLGGLCGLLALVRYDMLLPALMWPGLWSGCQPGGRLKLVASAYAVLLGLLLPWWWHQWMWFASPLASEHQVATLSLTPGLLTLMGPDLWRCDLCSQPVLWFGQRLGYLWHNSCRLLFSPSFAGFVPWAIVWGCGPRWNMARRPLCLGWFWWGCLTLGQLLSQSLTSYHDLRYGIPSCALAVFLWQRSPHGFGLLRKWPLGVLLPLLPMVLFDSVGQPVWQSRLGQRWQQQRQEQTTWAQWVPQVLPWSMVASHHAEFVATRLHQPAITWPRQLSFEQQQAWLARFHVQAGLAQHSWLLQQGWHRHGQLCCSLQDLCWIDFTSHPTCPWRPLQHRLCQHACALACKLEESPP